MSVQPLVPSTDNRRRRCRCRWIDVIIIRGNCTNTTSTIATIHCCLLLLLLVLLVLLILCRSRCQGSIGRVVVIIIPNALLSHCKFPTMVLHKFGQISFNI